MPIPKEILKEILKLKDELNLLCVSTYRGDDHPRMAYDLDTLAEKLWLNGVRRIEVTENERNVIKRSYMREGAVEYTKVKVNE